MELCNELIVVSSQTLKIYKLFIEIKILKPVMMGVSAQ